MTRPSTIRAYSISSVGVRGGSSQTSISRSSSVIDSIRVPSGLVGMVVMLRPYRGPPLDNDLVKSLKWMTVVCPQSTVIGVGAESPRCRALSTTTQKVSICVLSRANYNTVTTSVVLCTLLPMASVSGRVLRSTTQHGGTDEDRRTARRLLPAPGCRRDARQRHPDDRPMDPQGTVGLRPYRGPGLHP